MNQSVPLLISDIVSCSSKAGQIYPTSVAQSILLINNHPIQKISIFGRIIGLWSKNNGDGTGYYMLTVDDCSSSFSKINCKVTWADYHSTGLTPENHYGCLVEIRGILERFFSSFEVLTEVFTLLSRSKTHSLDLELSHWKLRLDYRDQVLKHPWNYIPTTSNAGKVVTRLSPWDQKRKEERSSLELPQYRAPSLIRDDSVVLAQVRAHERGCENRINEEDIAEVAEIDDDLEVVKVRDTPLQIVTEFQLTLAFVKWIIHANFRMFQLSHLYYDHSVAGLLELWAHSYSNLTQVVDGEVPDPVSLKPLQERKQILFHRVRHALTKCNLISVTKSQKVRSDNLKLVYEHITQCLQAIKTSWLDSHEIKILDVENYTATIRSRNIIAGDIDLRLINALIDHVVNDDFNERKSWKYDSKSTSWIYSPP